ncbi:hypothetical protein GQR60_11500 [Labilibaculum sp. A4]|uniref:sigma factor-like helix-turn-helix DNA-binding protein n=1 Tax=Labilibaculum euxinus TaxID=2686357 RepID=UPI000F624BD0|nr:sigma factor-like helix-turn-helix DNA-binding protein [Labilibaculum euxinus]MDQ1771022.1 sigma factor-like helix-turn-helix DNA-binding protein [Labilibaculum euxinus]MWN76967.1 hypothetical protein [Labilibaculum euxinus]
MTSTGQKLIELFNECLFSKRENSNKRVITDREGVILQKSYDFENNTFATHAEIAQEFGLSRERIRQIHNKALRKLRGFGRRANTDIPCKRLFDLLIYEVESSKGENTYEQLISFWNKHIVEISGDKIVKLCSHLLYAENKDINRNISAYKKWKKLQFAKIKREQLESYRAEKYKQKIKQKQDWLLSNVIWGEKKRIWKNINTQNLEPKREVNQDSDYITGYYESAKCKRKIQYESGIELNFILMLECMPNVKFFVEQPTTIEYDNNGYNHKYTPDFAVFLESGEAFIVEVKDMTGMADARVHRKFSALIEFCDNHGFGFLITDGKSTIENLLDRKYNKEFENEILNRLNDKKRKTMLYNEFKALREKYEIKWHDFLSFVIQNNLGFYPFPFKLNHSNSHQIYRERVIVHYQNNKNTQLIQ